MKLEHIPRWVVASIHKYIDANRGPVVLYLEGQNRQQNNEIPDHFELRVDGPHMHQITRSEWEFYVEISLFIHSNHDQKDLHKIHRLLGHALNAMAVCIPVYKYGDGLDDDRNLLGQLVRVDTPSEPTDVANFGQIESTLPVDQGTVAGKYYMCLTED